MEAISLFRKHSREELVLIQGFVLCKLIDLWCWCIMRSKPKDALQHFRGIFNLGFFQNLTPSLHMLFHLPIKREQTW